MVWWDRRLRNRLSEMGLNVHMYKGYVDDINIILGVNNTEGSVLNERGDGKAYDARVMDIVKSVANDIHQSIRVELDYPSKHEDNKIPILDLKVWVERREGTNLILHEFYSKEISSCSVIRPRSAVPSRVKRTVLKPAAHGEKKIIRTTLLTT